MKILILGANGFIGSHLMEAILKKTDWQIIAMDLRDDQIKDHVAAPRVEFKKGDMTKENDWLQKNIKAADVVLPLVAIATPSLYVTDPIRVFELDFEANLRVIRACVQHQTRIVFPSTSEVYGMCEDEAFNEESSHLVTGPIHKERWIYSTSKQLLDRLIYAYGKQHGLSYTLFRPFNWYGPRLDDVRNAKRGSSRVLTQFIGNILRGEDIHLVDGGMQKRCFTYIDDGIAALLAIIANKAQCADGQIFNIGNPYENISIRELAEILLQDMTSHFSDVIPTEKCTKLIEVSGKQYYGDGYQDVKLRVPSIKKAESALSWSPVVNIKDGLRKTLTYYFKDV